ncbi:MAG: hypothetical protein COA79_04985 [Planctomycetota bacterium]|nr:MAG: hypothetical protein COA79_04985 [Planctomycetota bacterium]
MLEDLTLESKNLPSDCQMNELASLTNLQKSDFRRNGFIVVENVLKEEEIQNFKKIISRLDKEEKIHRHGDLKGFERKPGEKLILRNAIKFDDSFLNLMVHPKVFPLIVDLMGPHIALMTSHLFQRPPTKDVAVDSFKQIGWHRDGACNGSPSENGIFPWMYTKIGFSFTDLVENENAGPLQIIPGSHRYDGELPIEKGSLKPYGAIDVKLKAGSAVIFDNRIFHSVGANTSDINRENIYFGYGWRNLRPIDGGDVSKELMDRCTPIQKQLLGFITDELSYYLPEECDVPLIAWNQKRKQ